MSAPSNFMRRGKSMLRLSTRLICLVLLGWLSLGGAAHASNCEFLPNFPSPLNFTVPISGSITVGRDLPVGSEIYRRSFSTTKDYAVGCYQGNVIYSRGFSSAPSLSSYVHPIYGAKIYNTSVAGVGVAVLIGPGDSALPVNNPLSLPNNYTMWLYQGQQYHLVFIKTASVVGSGAISGSALPKPRFRAGDNNLDFLFGQFSGSVNIVSRTCTTPDVSVSLGNHVLNEISGVGGTTSWVRVPISLNNCPAFFAKSLTGTYNDAGQSSQSSTPNTIQYRVDPVTSIVNPSQSVMALRPDGVNTTAGGIGIQVSDSGGNPVGFGANKNSGLALTQTDGASYTINLQARYYQTAANPTAGQANGAATVTLIYQ